MANSTWWEQVMTARNETFRTVPLPTIAEPPCSHCANFRPEIRVNARWGVDQVTICHAQDMIHDFSCFRDRESTNG